MCDRVKVPNHDCNFYPQLFVLAGKTVVCAFLSEIDIRVYLESLREQEDLDGWMVVCNRPERDTYGKHFTVKEYLNDPS